jgi:protein SCO1/2
MKPETRAHHTWGLLLVLLLVWPMTAAGHGPGPETAHDQRTTTKPGQTEPAVAPEDWMQEKIGDSVPLDAVFKNERGETVTLQQLIDRPTLLLPIYYNCPQLCSFELANLADAVRRSSRPTGSFRVISLSFNDEETPEIAARVKPNYTQMFAKDFPESDWVFLTGDNHNIRKVTGAIGYTFKKKEDSSFIHPSALAVLDKNGRIIKYIYGSFIPGDIDLALAQAAQGTLATSIRRILAFCLPANPRLNQEVFVLFRVGAVTILAVGGFFFLRFLRRNKKTSQSQSDS